MISQIGKNGTLYLPKKGRIFMGIAPGDRVSIQLCGDHLELEASELLFSMRRNEGTDTGGKICYL